MRRARNPVDDTEDIAKHGADRPADDEHEKQVQSTPLIAHRVTRTYPPKQMAWSYADRPVAQMGLVRHALVGRQGHTPCAPHGWHVSRARGGNFGPQTPYLRQEPGSAPTRSARDRYRG